MNRLGGQRFALQCRHLVQSTFFRNVSSLPNTTVSILFSSKRHTPVAFTECISTKHSVNVIRLYSSAPPGYWDYSKQYGPEKWEETWKTNKRQSPIDILTKLAQFDPELKSFTFNKTPIGLNLKNLGLNVSTTPNDEKHILLTGGPLKHQYQFREFHFHWGDMNTCGCEHTMDGHRFAAELHIVHWNKDLYKAEHDALSGVDGLAVLGVFLEAKETYGPNNHLDMLLDMFSKVAYKNSSFDSDKAFTPYALLPQNKDEYFTYPGSLTTPPLTENVTWTVFRHPLKMSVNQFQKFNSLFAVPVEEKDNIHFPDPFTRLNGKVPQPPTIANNYRPTQPLYGRTVYSSFKV